MSIDERDKAAAESMEWQTRFTMNENLEWVLDELDGA